MPVISTGRQRQEDLHKLEISLVYTVSPMSGLPKDPILNEKGYWNKVTIHGLSYPRASYTVCTQV